MILSISSISSIHPFTHSYIHKYIHLSTSYWSVKEKSTIAFSHASRKRLSSPFSFQDEIYTDTLQILCFHRLFKIQLLLLCPFITNYSPIASATWGIPQITSYPQSTIAFQTFWALSLCSFTGFNPLFSCYLVSLSVLLNACSIWPCL